MHCVDLGESFQTHFYLQNFVSIQPRTSSVEFAASRDKPRIDRRIAVQHRSLGEVAGAGHADGLYQSANAGTPAVTVGGAVWLCVVSGLRYRSAGFLKR